LVRAWAGAGDEEAVTELEAQADLESAQLRSLSAFDLAEIQRSLTELVS